MFISGRHFLYKQVDIDLSLIPIFCSIAWSDRYHILQLIAMGCHLLLIHLFDQVKHLLDQSIHLFDQVKHISDSG